MLVRRSRIRWVSHRLRKLIAGSASIFHRWFFQRLPSLGLPTSFSGQLCHRLRCGCRSRHPQQHRSTASTAGECKGHHNLRRSQAAWPSHVAHTLSCPEFPRRDIARNRTKGYRWLQLPSKGGLVLAYVLPTSHSTPVLVHAPTCETSQLRGLCCRERGGESKKSESEREAEEVSQLSRRCMCRTTGGPHLQENTAPTL